VAAGGGRVGEDLAEDGLDVDGLGKDGDDGVLVVF